MALCHDNREPQSKRDKETRVVVVAAAAAGATRAAEGTDAKVMSMRLHRAAQASLNEAASMAAAAAAV